jgi:hypothetical protein
MRTQHPTSKAAMLKARKDHFSLDESSSLSIRHTSFVVNGFSVNRFALSSVERNSGRPSVSPVIPAVST